MEACVFVEVRVGCWDCKFYDDFDVAGCRLVGCTMGGIVVNSHDFFCVFAARLEIPVCFRGSWKSGVPIVVQE